MRRFSVFLLGFLAALIMLEAGLRLVGLVHGVMESRDRQPLVFHGKGAYVLLCLGNSYTKGVGASSGMSYPEQLQRMFEKQMPGVRVRVINKGKEVQNTAELLSRLSLDLDTFKPDLVVLQTGQPNLWNLTGYDDYLKRKDREKGRGLGLAGRFTEALSHSRVYRLALLWRDAVQNKAAATWFSLDEYSRRRGDPAYAQAAKFIEEINSPFRKTKREDVPPAFVESVRSALKDAVAKDPGYPFNSIYIGDTYRFEANYEEAARWYMKSLEVDGRARNGEVYHIGYQAVRQIKKRLKGLEQARVDSQIDDFILEFKKRRPKEAVNFFLLKDDEIARWVASDMEEIVRKVQGRNIPLIIQNYPVMTHANEVLKEVAGRRGIPFVDNEKVFEEKMAGGVRKEDLFVPDEHCNDAGYALMAENVYRKITEEKLLS